MSFKHFYYDSLGKTANEEDATTLIIEEYNEAGEYIVEYFIDLRLERE